MNSQNSARRSRAPAAARQPPPRKGDALANVSTSKRNVLCSALWPEMSRSIPSFAFFDLYLGDLPTNTGAPGTVEKTVSVRVVVAPLALTYGSSSA